LNNLNVEQAFMSIVTDIKHRLDGENAAASQQNGVKSYSKTENGAKKITNKKDEKKSSWWCSLL
jgi:hypothetical protein